MIKIQHAASTDLCLSVLDYTDKAWQDNGRHSTVAAASCAKAINWKMQYNEYGQILMSPVRDKGKCLSKVKDLSSLQNAILSDCTDDSL